MEARTIEIRQGAIRIRDRRAELATLALKAALALHAGGLIAVIAAVAEGQGFNVWLIAAAGLYAIGVVSALSSLASAFHFSGSADSILRQAWAAHGEGRIAFGELFSSVMPVHPKMSDPGPIFGWLSALFFVGGCTLFALGMDFAAALAAVAG